MDPSEQEPEQHQDASDEATNERRHAIVRALRQDPATQLTFELIKALDAQIDSFTQEGQYLGAIERDKTDIHATYIPCVSIVRMHPHTAQGYGFLERMRGAGSMSGPLDEDEQPEHDHGFVFQSTRIEVRRYGPDEMGQKQFDAIIAAIEEEKSENWEESLADIKEHGIPGVGSQEDYLISAAYWPALTAIALHANVQIMHGAVCTNSPGDMDDDEAVHQRPPIN